MAFLIVIHKFKFHNVVIVIQKCILPTGKLNKPFLLLFVLPNP